MGSGGIDERQRDSGAQSAVRAERERRRLLAFLRKLPHDFANAILPFQIAADLLRRAPDDPTVIAQVQQMLEEQSARAQRLIEELERTSRVVRGELELESRRCDLEQVVKKGIAGALARDEQSVAVEPVAPSQPIEVAGDAGLLVAAVEELVANAIRYAGAGPVRVETQREGACATVRVVDQGPGIAPDRIDILFEPFAGAEAVEGGWGIGLGWARLVARAHGGSLELEPGRDGRGLEATLRLPLPD